MKRSLRQLTGLSLFALSLFTMSCNNDGKKPKTIASSEQDSICKDMASSLLSKAVGLKNDSALFEVYVLKQSADSNQSDFNLAIFLRDSADHYIDSNWTGDRQQFENEEANYFRYLKNRHVPISEVGTNYTLMLDWPRLNAQKPVNICISVPAGNMSYTFYSNTQPGDTSALRVDSACCKCPPHCPTMSPKALHAEIILKGVYESKAD